MLVLLTGLPCSGKSTLALEILKKLRTKGVPSEWLDGDFIRKNLWRDLGFSPEDRRENLKRVGVISNLLSRNDIVVLASFVSPTEEARAALFREIEDDVEVIRIYVKCTQYECARRDVKGMWAMAKKGEIEEFTGWTAPYEIPYPGRERGDLLVVDTEKNSLEKCVDQVMKYLEENHGK